MLNKLWNKAQEMAHMLQTDKDEEYIVALKIYRDLIKSYIDKLNYNKKLEQKRKYDSQKARYIKTRRVRRIINGLF